MLFNCADYSKEIPVARAISRQMKMIIDLASLYSLKKPKLS